MQLPAWEAKAAAAVALLLAAAVAEGWRLAVPVALVARVQQIAGPAEAEAVPLARRPAPLAAVAGSMWNSGSLAQATRPIPWAREATEARPAETQAATALPA